MLLSTLFHRRIFIAPFYIRILWGPLGLISQPFVSLYVEHYLILQGPDMKSIFLVYMELRFLLTLAQQSPRSDATVRVTSGCRVTFEI